MPHRNYAAVLFTFILLLSSSKTFGQRSCGSIGGECLEVFDCMSARNSIQNYGTHSLERCGWNGLVEKVCCLDNPKTGSLTVTSSEEEASVWGDDEDMKSTTPKTAVTATTKSNEPRGTVRKSEKVCAQYATRVRGQIDWHILGGENAEIGEFPHMVGLGYTNPDDRRSLLWNCAGSLISDRWVLSAAHCVIRIQPIKALVGVLNITEQSATRKEYDILNITIYPEYVRRQGRHDIALLKVSETVVFGDLVYPACLYLKDNDPLGLIITGWGKIYLGQDIRSETLQKARVIPIPLGSCNATYLARLNRSLNPGQLCAGPVDPSIPTDSCPGDSGGPLQLLQQDNTYAVVGIISFGLTDCGGDAPSVYTRVSQYLDWIEGIVWP